MTAATPASDNARNRLSAEERRAQLLNSAIRVFSQRGFNGAKTKDIAAEAGVNEALLFRHFPTKDELYAAILDSAAADDWVEAIRGAVAVAGDDPYLFVREYVKRTLAWQRNRPEMLNLVLYSALEQHELSVLFREKQVAPVLQILTEYITARQSEGRFTKSVPAEQAARVLFGTVAYQGLVILLLRGANTGMSDEEAADVIARLAIDGLKHRGSARDSRKSK